MYQQYFDQAKAAISYLQTDELKELLNNDENLEKRVNEVVIIHSIQMFYIEKFDSLKS